MERIVFALLAGLVGGAAGALAVDLVRPGPRAVSGEGAAAPAGHEWKEVLDRLGRIEEALPPAGVAAGTLQGRPGGEAAPSEPLSEAVLARMEERVSAAVEKTWTELQERSGGKSAEAKPAAKKRLPLAQVAAELGLSRSEEDELREIYRDSEEKLLKILAEPDGDLDAVRKDLATAKTDKAKGAVMMKYLPKVLPKIGDLMMIQVDRDARVEALLGPERSARYERYEVEEGDPFGFGGSVRMEATNR